MLSTGGAAIHGHGLGATGTAVGEVCFNTAMTGYQEIMTDPSYAGQIITFTFPHIGNVGVNPEDVEAARPAARGCVLRADISAPSNWRAAAPLGAWLREHGIPAIGGGGHAGADPPGARDRSADGRRRARSGGTLRHRRAGRRKRRRGRASPAWTSPAK